MNETERNIIDALEAQLAAKNHKYDSLFEDNSKALNRILELEQQLAEAKAQLATAMDELWIAFNAQDRYVALIREAGELLIKIRPTWMGAMYTTIDEWLKKTEGING